MTEIEQLIEQAEQVLANLPVLEPGGALYMESSYIEAYYNRFLEALPAWCEVYHLGVQARRQLEVMAS